MLARPRFIDGRRFRGLHFEQGGDFHRLPRPETVIVLSFFSVPEKTRTKFNFCTKGSIRVLKHCATSGPAGSALISTSAPSALVGRAFDEVRRNGADGQGVEQFSEALAGLARHAENRNQRALRDGQGDELGEFFVGGRSAFEIALGHRFIDFDDRLQQRFADFGGIDQRAGRIGGRLERGGHAAEIRDLVRAAR